jgi:hypothetical protein
MRKLRSLFLMSALGQLAAGQAIAQQAALAEGARVRLVTTALPADHQVARIVSADNDSIVFRSDAYPVTRSLALSQIDRIDVSEGRHRQAGSGAMIGLGIGAIGGGILGAASFSPCNDGWCIGPQTRTGNTALGAALFGALGGLTGAIIGSFYQRENWKSVMARPTTALNAAGERTFGFQVSRTF